MDTKQLPSSISTQEMSQQALQDSRKTSSRFKAKEVIKRRPQRILTLSSRLLNKFRTPRGTAQRFRTVWDQLPFDILLCILECLNVYDSVSLLTFLGRATGRLGQEYLYVLGLKYQQVQKLKAEYKLFRIDRFFSSKICDYCVTQKYRASHCQRKCGWTERGLLGWERSLGHCEYPMTLGTKHNFYAIQRDLLLVWRCKIPEPGLIPSSIWVEVPDDHPDRPLLSSFDFRIISNNVHFRSQLCVVIPRAYGLDAARTSICRHIRQPFFDEACKKQFSSQVCRMFPATFGTPPSHLAQANNEWIESSRAVSSCSSCEMDFEIQISTVSIFSKLFTTVTYTRWHNLGAFVSNTDPHWQIFIHNDSPNSDQYVPGTVRNTLERSLPRLLPRRVNKYLPKVPEIFEQLPTHDTRMMMNHDLLTDESWKIALKKPIVGPYRVGQQPGGEDLSFLTLWEGRFDESIASYEQTHEAPEVKRLKKMVKSALKTTKERERAGKRYNRRQMSTGMHRLASRGKDFD